MSKLHFIGVITILALTLLLGFQVGKNSSEQAHLLEIANLNENYTKELQRQAEKQQITQKKYLQAKEQINNLYDTNDKLINSMYNNSNSNSVQTGTDPNTSTPNEPTEQLNPELSREMAQDITKITREADEVANYAKECYLFLKDLQQQQQATK